MGNHEWARGPSELLSKSDEAGPAPARVAQRNRRTELAGGDAGDLASERNFCGESTTSALRLR